MNQFNTIVLIVASIICVFTFLYIVINYGKRDKTFAPVVTDCPDYWTANVDGTCNIPKNGQNMGSIQGHPIYYYNMGDRKSYSLLSKFFSIPNGEVLVGTSYTNKENKALGYYKTDFPAGYDENNPQIGVVNFNDIGWSKNGVSECEIKRWSKIHSIAWDGMNTISYC